MADMDNKINNDSFAKLIEDIASLNNMQQSSLYGVTSGFISSNKNILNKLINNVNEILSTGNINTSNKIPEYINSIVDGSMSELNKKFEKETNIADYTKSIKGINDTSLDMQLFNEIHSLVVPSFEVFYEYELIHKIIPEFRRALELIHLSIMSPDDFNKKYLLPSYNNNGIVLNADSSNDTESVIYKMRELIEEFKLESKISDWIYDSLKYGCKPILVIPIDDRFRSAAKKALLSDFKTYDTDKKNNDYLKNTSVINNESLSFDEFENKLEISIENDDQLFNSLETYVDIVSENLEKERHNLERMDQLDIIEEKEEFIKNFKGSKKDISKKIAKEVSQLVKNTVIVSYNTEESFCDTIIKEYKPNLRAKRKYVQEQVRFYASKKRKLSMEDMNDIINKVYDEYDNYNENRTDLENVLDEIYNDIITTEAYNAMGTNLSNITPTKVNRLSDDNLEKNNSGGSVIVPLSPDMVVPISIHGEHIGYYIIERLGQSSEFDGFATMLGYRSSKTGQVFAAAGSLYGSAINNGMFIRNLVDIPQNGGSAAAYQERFSLLKRLFVRTIAERLDNPDLIESNAFNSIIYSLIKEDYIVKKQIKITYVPASMLIYYAYKISPITGIGKSIYEDSLFMAHIYIATLITNLMIKISKSADREQLWIELGVDKRIEAKVQNVIRTLQSKRIGVSDLRSVDNILKTVGQFQRYIGMKNDGKPIVDIESIPGQNVDMDGDFQDKLLKSGVVAMGVPASAMNLLEEQEYAKTIALQNGFFLHMIVGMQSAYKECNTKLIRLLLRNKYPSLIYTKNNNKTKDNKNLIDLKNVVLDLPSPNALNITNMSDALSQASDIIDKIIDIIVQDGIENADTVKWKLKQKLLNKYCPSIEWETYKELYEEARMEANEDIISKNNTGNDNNVDTYG